MKKLTNCLIVIGWFLFGFGVAFVLTSVIFTAFLDSVWYGVTMIAFFVLLFASPLYLEKAVVKLGERRKK